MDILFKFTGSIYWFETLAKTDFEVHTRAVSKEQAMNNFKNRAKHLLGYGPNAKVFLTGKLRIFYRNCIESYDVTRNELKIKESAFDNIKFEYVSDNKVKYNNEIMSLEQAKYMSSTPEKSRWFIFYENGYKEDITNQIKVNGSCIIYNDIEYIFDDEEGVYWKYGIPFAERIQEV